VTDAFVDVRQGLQKYYYYMKIEEGSYYMLALLGNVRNFEILVKCRETVNPVGAVSINVGKSLLPCTASEVVNSICSPKSFPQDSFYANANREDDTLVSLTALFIYSIYGSIIYPKKCGEVISEITLAQPIPMAKTLRNIRAALPRINKTLIMLNSSDIGNGMKEVLKITDEDLREIIDTGKTILDGCIETLEKTEQDILVKGTLSAEKLNRFSEELREEMLGEWSRLPLFKYRLLGQCEGFTYKKSSPREAFISDTNVHYSSKGLGAHIFNIHHGKLAWYLLSESNGSFSAERCSPSPHCEIVVATKEGLEVLAQKGFSDNGSLLKWPDNLYSRPLYRLNADGKNIYVVVSGESICRFDLRDCNLSDELPVIINYEDKQGEIVHTVTVNIDPI